MIENNTNIQRTRKEIISEFKIKTTFYKKEKIYIFLKTRDNFIYNGYITTIFENYIILLDKYNKEIPIAFSELERIDPWVDPLEKENFKK